MHIRGLFWLFSLDFNREIVWIDGFRTLSGFTGQPLQLSEVDNGAGDGTVLLGQRYTAREMIVKKRITWDKADYYQRYFEGRTHTLYVGSRRINCFCRHAEIDHRGRFSLDPDLVLDLHCPDPFFYDVSDYQKNLAEIVPCFGFPWRVTAASGICMGYRMYTDTTLFENIGIRPVGFTVKFVASRGAAEGFTFENVRTGEYIRVHTALALGDVLEISTVWGNKYVRLNGADIYDAADITSGFFELAVGENYLTYAIDAGKTNVDVYLSYAPKYMNALKKDVVR